MLTEIRPYGRARLPITVADVESQPVLGTRLRQLRKQRQLTLAAVAQTTGISAGFLSLVETGKHDISISRLLRLARFYHVSMANLLGLTQATTPLIVRRDEQRHIESPAEAIDLLVLPMDGVPAAIAVYEPGGGITEATTMNGNLFVYVLEGAIEILFDAGDSFELAEGDSAYYSAERPHSYTNASAGLTRVLGVQIYPR